MLIGFDLGRSSISLSPISFLIPSQSCVKWRSHSLSVNCPRLCKVLSCAALALPDATCTSLSAVVETSDNATVIPATVEYLKPKSFKSSKIGAKSSIGKRLNISPITIPRFFFLKSSLIGIAAMYSFTFVPMSTKNLSGVATKFSALVVIKYGKSVGKTSLKIIFPIVVINNWVFCFSLKPVLTIELALTATLVCKCTSFAS